MNLSYAGHRALHLAALDMLSEVTEAVARHMGEPVPSVNIVIGDSGEIAERRVAAAGASWTAIRRWRRYARRIRRESRTALATAIPGQFIPTIVLTPRLAAKPHLLWRTLVHERAHTVQFTRPGVRDRWLTGELNNLGIKPLSWRAARALNRAVRADEREAYAVEDALADIARADARSGASS